MTLIHTDGGHLEIDTTGDDRRPALVLLGPLGATLDVWEPLLEPLLERHWVIRINYRGHGESTLARTDEATNYSVADLAADVIAVLDALEVERAAVFGVSLGGLVALELAIEASDRVSRLVVASASLRLGSDEWWERTAEVAVEDGMEAVADRLQRMWFSDRCLEHAPEICATSRSLLLATPLEAYVEGIRAILRVDFLGRLENVRASTLLIYGERDVVLKYNRVEDLLDHIDDAEAVMVGETAHRVFLEQPDAIASLVAQFLTDPDAH